MTVTWTDVFSSNVSRIGYDDETQSMVVEWSRGKTSRYKGVSPELAESVSRSWSVGTAIREQIIPNYEHEYI